MAEKDRGYMPQSTAGLIRYFDSDEGVKIKPEIVVGLGIAFGAVVLVMRFLV